MAALVPVLMVLAAWLVAFPFAWLLTGRGIRSSAEGLAVWFGPAGRAARAVYWELPLRMVTGRWRPPAARCEICLRERHACPRTSALDRGEPAPRCGLPGGYPPSYRTVEPLGGGQMIVSTTRPPSFPHAPPPPPPARRTLLGRAWDRQHGRSMADQLDAFEPGWRGPFHGGDSVIAVCTNCGTRREYRSREPCRACDPPLCVGCGRCPRRCRCVAPWSGLPGDLTMQAEAALAVCLTRPNDHVANCDNIRRAMRPIADWEGRLSDADMDLIDRLIAAFDHHELRGRRPLTVRAVPLPDPTAALAEHLAKLSRRGQSWETREQIEAAGYHAIDVTTVTDRERQWLRGAPITAGDIRELQDFTRRHLPDGSYE
jgi:hypothetical protein